MWLPFSNFSELLQIVLSKYYNKIYKIVNFNAKILDDISIVFNMFSAYVFLFLRVGLKIREYKWRFPVATYCNP